MVRASAMDSLSISVITAGLLGTSFNEWVLVRTEIRSRIFGKSLFGLMYKSILACLSLSVLILGSSKLIVVSFCLMFWLIKVRGFGGCDSWLKLESWSIKGSNV